MRFVFFGRYVVTFMEAIYYVWMPWSIFTAVVHLLYTQYQRIRGSRVLEGVCVRGILATRFSHTHVSDDS